MAQYYLNDPNAPKPNRPTRIGTNVYLEWDGKLLLECRWDCCEWGLIGGKLRMGERDTRGIAREVREETGIFLPENAFRKLGVCDGERIAAYRDGTVWRMVIVLFQAVLTKEPNLKPSRESRVLRFFPREELRDLKFAATHCDLIEAWRRGEIEFPKTK